MLEYHAAYYPIEDGWFLVEVLDFPGAFTQGKDLDDARYMVRDVLKLVAECRLEEGKPLPRPNPRAKSKKAILVEPVYLSIRVTRGRQHEKDQTAPISARA